MVSKASEDFPEPLKPVTTTSWLRGIVTLMFLRLCSRAPRTTRCFGFIAGEAKVAKRRGRGNPGGPGLPTVGGLAERKGEAHLEGGSGPQRGTTGGAAGTSHEGVVWIVKRASAERAKPGQELSTANGRVLYSLPCPTASV